MTEPVTYALGPNQTLRVTASTPELLALHATWAAGPGDPPPSHLHPSQDEHFEVLRGELTAVVGDERHVLRPGDALDVPRGVAHRMWNSAAEPTEATWEVRPAQRTEELFATVSAITAAQAAGEPPPAAAATLLEDFGAELQLVPPAQG